MQLRRFLIAVTIFIALLRWNVILHIFDNLHVVSSLLDQCSKNEHMQNFLMHMLKLKKSNTYVQASPLGHNLIVQYIKNRLNKVLVQNGLTLLRPSDTSSLKFADRSIAIAVSPLWNKLPPALHQISDPFYELTKTSPLVISPQLFHYKLKTLVFSKSYPDSSSSSLPPSPSELQKPSECLESIYLNNVYYSKFQDNNAIVNSI